MHPFDYYLFSPVIILLLYNLSCTNRSVRLTYLKNVNSRSYFGHINFIRRY